MQLDVVGIRKNGVSKAGVVSYHHGVYLPFDLLVPGQRSLQTLFGVQLRVPTLINVTVNAKTVC